MRTGRAGELGVLAVRLDGDFQDAQSCRAREWKRGAALWREVQALDPEDGIARVYIARICDFKAGEPAPEWDGAVALGKM